MRERGLFKKVLAGHMWEMEWGSKELLMK